MFAVNQGLDVNALCKVFPSNLRGEIFYEMHQKLVRQVPMFKDCNDNFIRAIVKILQPLVLLNGDYCFRIHETSGEMYFIHRGFMQMVNEDGSVIFATLREGAFFGEVAMFTTQRRTASARALDDCILYSMTVTDFEEVIQDYPKFYDSILDKAMQRLDDIVRANGTSLEYRMQQVFMKGKIRAQAGKKGLGLKQRTVTDVLAEDGPTGKRAWSNLRKVVNVAQAGVEFKNSIVPIARPSLGRSGSTGRRTVSRTTGGTSAEEVRSTTGSQLTDCTTCGERKSDVASKDAASAPNDSAASTVVSTSSGGGGAGDGGEASGGAEGGASFPSVCSTGGSEPLRRISSDSLVDSGGEGASFPSAMSFPSASGTQRNSSMSCRPSESPGEGWEWQTVSGGAYNVTEVEDMAKAIAPQDKAGQSREGSCVRFAPNTAHNACDGPRKRSVFFGGLGAGHNGSSLNSSPFTRKKSFHSQKASVACAPKKASVFFPKLLQRSSSRSQHGSISEGAAPGGDFSLGVCPVQSPVRVCPKTPAGAPSTEELPAEADAEDADVQEYATALRRSQSTLMRERADWLHDALETAKYESEPIERRGFKEAARLKAMERLRAMEALIRISEDTRDSHGSAQDWGSMNHTGSEGSSRELSGEAGAPGASSPDLIRQVSSMRTAAEVEVSALRSEVRGLSESVATMSGAIATNQEKLLEAIAGLARRLDSERRPPDPESSAVP